MGSGIQIRYGDLFLFKADSNEALFDVYSRYETALRSEGMMFQKFDDGIDEDPNGEEAYLVIMRVVKAPEEYSTHPREAEIGDMVDRNSLLTRLRLEYSESFSLEKFLACVGAEYCFDTVSPEQALRKFCISKEDICLELSLPTRLKRATLAEMLGVDDLYLKRVLSPSKKSPRRVDTSQTIVDLLKFRLAREAGIQ